jgi:isoquinoline 1-oxidoreductase alpha subunit
MSKISFTVNGKGRDVDSPGDRPLLWVLREDFGLTGTKFGCGASQCGACTVHVDGKAVRSCVTPVSSVEGKAITTIEGMDHALQKAWEEQSVPQCGYCQSGQIMTATALLAANPKPSSADIDKAMAGNLCRCGSYPRIKAAIESVIPK